MANRLLPVALCVAGFAPAMFAQSAVTRTIKTTANVKVSAAVAVGDKSYAGVGGADVQGSKVNGTLADTSNINQSAAVAVGTDAKAEWAER